MKKCCTAFRECHSYRIFLQASKLLLFYDRLGLVRLRFRTNCSPGPLCHLARLFFISATVQISVIKFVSRFLRRSLLNFAARFFGKATTSLFIKTSRLPCYPQDERWGNISVNISWTEILRRLHFQQLKDTTTMEKARKN